jgi:hypothetical protein
VVGRTRSLERMRAGGIGFVIGQGGPPASLSSTVSRHRACGRHFNIQATSSVMKSTSSIGKAPTKTGCRWFGRCITFSRSQSRHGFTPLPPSGDFTSLPLRRTRGVARIFPSPSFGDLPTGAFRLPLVASLTGGWTTDRQSRFVRSRASAVPSSLSFSGSWHQNQSMRNTNANSTVERMAAGGVSLPIRALAARRHRSARRSVATE